MEKKNHSIIMLPSKNPSHLYLSDIGKENKLYFSSILVQKDKYGRIPQHLYILSEEKPEEADWYITEIGELGKVGEIQYGIGSDDIDKMCNNEWLYANCKKVIATTDPALSYKILEERKTEGYKVTITVPTDKKMPEISSSFVRAFCKAFNKEEVIKELSLEMIKTIQGDFGEYTILQLKLRSNNTVLIHKIDDVVKKAWY